MTLKDHMVPKRSWGKDDWLKYAQVMVHSPWIDKEEKEYWRDKIKELS